MGSTPSFTEASRDRVAASSALPTLASRRATRAKAWVRARGAEAAPGSATARSRASENAARGVQALGEGRRTVRAQKRVGIVARGQDGATDLEDSARSNEPEREMPTQGARRRRLQQFLRALGGLLPGEVGVEERDDLTEKRRRRASWAAVNEVPRAATVSVKPY